MAFVEMTHPFAHKPKRAAGFERRSISQRVLWAHGHYSLCPDTCAWLQLRWSLALHLGLNSSDYPEFVYTCSRTCRAIKNSFWLFTSFFSVKFRPTNNTRTKVGTKKMKFWGLILVDFCWFCSRTAFSSLLFSLLFLWQMLTNLTEQPLCARVYQSMQFVLRTVSGQMLKRKTSVFTIFVPYKNNAIRCSRSFC